MSLTVTSEDLLDKGNQIIQLYNQYLGRDPLQGGLDLSLIHISEPTRPY